MDKFSYLSNADNAAIEDIYGRYLQAPESVEYGWRKFFEGFEFARKNFQETGALPESMHTEFKVINLINGYRSRGHLFTKTNPVRERRKYKPTLAIRNFGLTEADLTKDFQAGSEIGIGKASLEKIIDHLEKTYCQFIGIEYSYIRHPERVSYIRNQIELRNRPVLSNDEKLHIMKKLNQATLFEQFLQKKFVGQKRFSLEGGEALIPALDRIIEHGALLGVQEVVVGMPHRGRLNVLANIFNKTYADIFSEFEGKEYEDSLFDGDVKYHLGFSGTETTNTGKKVHLTLAPNPSHLEAVDPVVQGIARAKLDRYLHDTSKIVPILIHGDAAIAGQGIIYEVVQMAQLDGYGTGGTVHIVINNQVGFTTNYKDGRSSTYCTDVAKTTLCPVFHVNGDSMEAVVQTVQIAIEYRQKFKRDVFIDLLCYRKYGHNEGDEPKFTQPNLYKAIARHPNPREIYKNQLMAEGVLTEAANREMQQNFHDALQNRFDESKKIKKATVSHFLKEDWKHLTPAKANDFEDSPDTSFDENRLLELGRKMATLPEDKKYFRKIVKILKDRLNMLETDRLDWGMGEMLAYASLLDEGYPVRISGQDVERGTFSHRHAVVTTEDDEEEIITLNRLSEKQAQFTIYNSLLSEYGVLGFEYGYALAAPDALTIWEAQFGDFNNGAQIIIDQFISSGEDKWHTMNGLCMFLPHGYEGMGSEHSSGRMERYLILCAEENIQVVNITTPANFFHVLRRQLHRSFRKPLIVFTPKKLLRLNACVSSLGEMANGRFQELIDDRNASPEEVHTLVFCSGKIYYDTLEQLEKQPADNLAIVRMEQLYPVPYKQMDEVVAKYHNTKHFIWLQEEPENMGAWAHIFRSYRKVNWEVIARPANGSPASGSSKVHEKRHKALFTRLYEYTNITASSINIDQT